ncbi:lantibiotic dehydratase [Pedobacter rhodius]|uniref:Lantibiotic dehydratase n=1 Tax=Pedobacter rhodius TaxID=3004098 RepID=A0ABT4L199_9SPHI|nr:lantibiotic dehydratase [Pedobacter sp. SJ11]MCZ4224830.1 lantibiotic dehydratase [Pedobacter sp. SJ11]
MNEKNSNNYQFLPQVFLRAPYYSFSGYDLNRLPEVLEEQAFRNAVWLASPEFYRLLEKKKFDFNQLKDKEKHTLYKYYNRMCFRSTPFGSFASFTLVEWGNDLQIKLANNDKAVLHLLPDQQLLHQLRNTSQSISPLANLMVNPSLYRFENVFRYIKSTVNEKGRYSFFLEAISGIKFNSALFSFLGVKKVPLSDVMHWIKVHGECTEEEALDYIGFLVNAQAVYSDMHGGIIDTEPACNGMNLPGWNDFWKTYRSVTMHSDFLLDKIAGELKHISTGRTDTANTQPFYAALERPVESGSMDMAMQKALSKAVQVLQLLSVYEQPEDFSRFVSEFRARFDREKVPLLLAIDPDAGLPYGSTEASNPNPGILENLVFPKRVSENNQVGWNTVQQLLFKLWIGDTLRDPWSPLQISEEDLLQLESNNKALPLPQSQAIMYRDTGEHLIIESSGGATGVSLIGRFSSFSEHVHACCLELAGLEAKANPDVVFADIGQFSDTHVDNINRRMPIYPYEIPLNVYPAQQEENLICPDDLLLSFQGDELILESLRLGKRVIPRLTTAYNFRNNHLPVFRFLCDLQFQGIKAGLSFDLENFFPGLTFYPRVSYGRVIFSLAKWNFKERDLDLLIGDGSVALPDALQAFRRIHRIPRHISMGLNDQQLVFDLAQANEGRFFVQCLSGLKSISITEYLLPDRAVQTGKKPLAGQMIAFLVHNQNIYQAIKPVKRAAINQKSRSFMMGSNWLYLKIYCIPRASDTILAKVILPFLTGQRKQIKNWFFIRYNEKGYHLRLRIQARESELGILLVALRKKMESGGYHKLIRNYQGDTYQREIERYGHQLINDVERFFRAGSDLVIWVIKARQANKEIWSEFELALISADRIISCLLPNYELRLIYLDEVIKNFLIEFKADKVFKIAMDNKYREMKKVIADLLVKKVKLKVFRLFLKEIDAIDRLTTHYLPVQKTALLADLVHMQLNRTFSVQQRQQELLVYYCLQKYVASGLARTKPINHSV